LLSVTPLRDPPVSSPPNHPRKHEPVLHIRTPPQGKPRAWPLHLAAGGTRDLRPRLTPRSAPDLRCDADPDTERDANVSLDDYTFDRSGDLSRQRQLVQRGPRFRLFALRQQLLARIQHGDLHRFAAVQRDLGFVRNSIRSGRPRLHNSAGDRPIASTNRWNVPEWESNSDSHYHGGSA